MPAFFIAAIYNKSNLFTRHPKLDVNAKSDNGLNVTWYFPQSVTVIDDKRYDPNEIHEDKSLLDVAIEDFDRFVS